MNEEKISVPRRILEDFAEKLSEIKRILKGETHER